MKLGWKLFMGAFALVGLSGVASAIEVDGTGCTDLMAGQHIYVGQVCATVDGEDLTVTYTMDSGLGWTIIEAQLYVGNTIPTASNPGGFEFNDSPFDNVTEVTYTKSLADLGGTTTLCDAATNKVYIAAHATVTNPDGSGTETAWAKGPEVPGGVGWSMYYEISFSCPPTDDPEPEEKEPSCETAFAFGDKTLIEVGVTNSRWGWQNTVASGASIDQTIYAGAGGNDISKGTEVGSLSISYDGSNVDVSFSMSGSFTLSETHVYAGATEVPTVAPGKYGNQNELSDATSDSFSISVTGDPVYVVAHAVVCGAFEE